MMNKKIIEDIEIDLNGEYDIGYFLGKKEGTYTLSKL
jgi:hypothetical protein